MVLQFLPYHFGRFFIFERRLSMLCLTCSLAVSACSNDTSKSPTSAEAKVGAVVANDGTAGTQSGSENKSDFEKVLTTRDRMHDKSSGPLRCDKNGICAYSEPETPVGNKATALQSVGLSTSYKDLAFEFSLTEKVNEFGRFVVSSKAFEQTGIVNDLLPATQTSFGFAVEPRSSPLLSVTSFVSASSLSFNHCFVPQERALESQSSTSDFGRFPGMYAQYGMDALGHWIFANRIQANLTGPNDSPVWHRVEVVSEVLSIQGKSPVEMPKSEKGMRFSTWMVSQVPYSIRSSVVLYPEGAFAGSTSDAPVELSITTAWGLPRTEVSAVSKVQSQVLTFSQIWECLAGVPCPKLINEVPLYWYEETLAKGLGRSWKLKDKLSNLTWNGSGWRSSTQTSSLCGI